jgi:single-strand DNA-binding protein
MNSVALIGRLGRSPEIKETNGGKLAAFSIAVTRNKDTTDWFDCKAFAKTAEMAEAYLTKGSQIGVSGRLQVETWEGKDGKKNSKVVVIVDRFTFCGPRPEQRENLDDSEIPF